VLHSFLLAEEHFSQIEIRGSTKDGALGINARGQVVSDYSDAENVSHGCVWDKGTITTINVPGAFGTSASDINEHSQVVGNYSTVNTSIIRMRGFLWENGFFTLLEVPGAGDTFVDSIKNRGEVVGP
jgi:uncharacterized membrane protein